MEFQRRLLCIPYNKFLGCSLVSALRKVVVAMFVATTSRCIREILYSSFRLDFHSKRANLREIVYSSDTTCFNQIKMNSGTFKCLCHMLNTIEGLRLTRHMLVDEQVAMFLHILAHYVKNRVVQFEFGRSSETISRYFKLVMNVTLKLQPELFKIA